MSEIVLDKVTKRFGAVKVVDGVSFRAEKGKFIVLPAARDIPAISAAVHAVVYAGGD